MFQVKWHPSRRGHAYVQRRTATFRRAVPEPPDRRGAVDSDGPRTATYAVTLTTLVGRDTITVTFAMNVCPSHPCHPRK